MKSFKQCGEVDVKLVALIALAELVFLHVIYSCVYQYSDIRSVVDAFSFGGTLVGILVGVIAIIYAFYQGAAQQQTNNTMVAELTKLSSIKEEIALSSTTLKDQLRDLGLFTARLETIDQNVTKTQSHVESISLIVSKQGQGTNVGTVGMAASGDSSRSETINLIKRFIKVRNDVLVFADAYIIRSDVGGRNFSQYAEELLDFMKEDSGKFSHVNIQFMMQTIGMVVQIYNAAGILSVDYASGNVAWRINKEYGDARSELIDYLRRHVDADNKPIIEKILLV